MFVTQFSGVCEDGVNIERETLWKRFHTLAKASWHDMIHENTPSGRIGPVAHASRWK